MTSQASHNTFKSEPGFCPDCGAVLPQLRSLGGVKCYTCAREFGPEVFGSMEEHYNIHLNSVSDFDVKKSEGAAGPVVERRCPKCNNDQMSYATLQLRSADEGQTIFYTCTKCNFKETENS